MRCLCVENYLETVTVGACMQCEWFKMDGVDVDEHAPLHVDWVANVNFYYEMVCFFFVM